MSEKIVGYVLLALGIVVIIFSGFDVYQVFTKQKRPVQLFNLPGISLDLSRLTPETSSIDLSKLLPEGTPPELLSKITSPQKASTPLTQEIMNKDMVNQPMNIFAHLMLMGFISTIGLKLSTIGVFLLRPVVVNVKEVNQLTQPK